VAAMFCLVLGLSVAACGTRQTEDTATTEPTTMQPSDIQVASVELGRDVDTNNRVTTPTDQFKPNDVIYVTVLTTGSSPSATLKSVWLYEDGQVVEETQQVISPAGETATEFHVSKPDGLPAGKYRVEISLNGTPVQSKEFVITA
jgi:hypothetical protein